MSDLSHFSTSSNSRLAFSRHVSSFAHQHPPLSASSGFRQEISLPPQYSRRIELPDIPRPVYTLVCRHCKVKVCVRGMKAILLADMNVELYSTDTPSDRIQLMDKDYLTRTCFCRIRDVACLGCGNIIGYHVVSPCHHCLGACNNGHFWMFHSDACDNIERKDPTGRDIMLWSKLPRAEKDVDFLMGASIPYHFMCR